ncbi:MAG: orotate phosphoribosyltransferase [Treponema sp.]|jgi:orotate phosphoribosyltransferase|nr:orotate phosphoribosyltransferase [Treponema sp.]
MIDAVTLLKRSGAMLEGHFILSSGRHSNRYVQCAKLLQHPDKAALALAPITERIREAIQARVIAVDAIVGPALGGVIVAYELGRQLGLPAFFTERDDSGIMTLRRGFEVEEGMGILIAEDVITTAKSSLETAKALEKLGARIIALACIVDRRAEGGALAALPLYAAVKIEATNWDEKDCPLCRQGVPAVKPGSRKMSLYAISENQSATVS